MTNIFKKLLMKLNNVIDLFKWHKISYFYT